jgi:hypothetical protein
MRILGHDWRDSHRDGATLGHGEILGLLLVQSTSRVRRVSDRDRAGAARTSAMVDPFGRSRRTCCSPSPEPAPSRPALPGDGPPGPAMTAVCDSPRGNGSLPVRDPYPLVSIPMNTVSRRPSPSAHPRTYPAVSGRGTAYPSCLLVDRPLLLHDQSPYPLTWEDLLGRR